ncbi:Succinate-semialdehyde dehydrogenase, mitochondrial [Anthophora plagiata]
MANTQLAIDAASNAFKTFSQTTAKERSDLLRNWYNLMVKHSEDLAQILTKENGKSIAESKGVAALITPWNFPHAMITRKAGAALAAGCTCVIKPSEDTPLTALALADLAEKAGFPHGTVNCASNIKRISLELGGNAPFIVFDSANMDVAVSGAMASKFRNTGQTCVSANRFFVQAGKFDEFIEKFLSKMKCEIKMGDGSKADVTHGPLIKESQLNMVHGLVTDAVQKGAKVHCGGTPLPELGPLFYAPTLITGVTQEMKIYSQEIFGPVAVIHKFTTEDEAIQKSNDTPVGLAGYFYSEDVSQIFRVAKKLEVGMVGVNEGLISTAEAAFGGVKESGIGREGSRHGVDDFLDIKYVCLGNLKL